LASCFFRPIQNDFERVLVVALISGILSAPFSILFQSLIMFVLAAKIRCQPSVSGLERKRNAHQSDPRRPGFTRGDEFLETSLPEDLNNLLSGVRSHRETLSSDKLLDFESKFIF
jgi:hypothetical protein